MVVKEISDFSSQGDFWVWLSRRFQGVMFMEISGFSVHENFRVQSRGLQRSVVKKMPGLGFQGDFKVWLSG